MGRRSAGSSTAVATALAILAVLVPATAAAADGRVALGDGVYMERAPAGAPAPEAPAATPRIIGGHPVTIQDYPWQVGLLLSPAIQPGNGFDRQICGGTLVAPTLVVTAAHCVADGNGNFQPAANFTIVSGRTTLSTNAGRESGLAGYVYFVDAQGRQLYNPRTFAWDVVLLRLAQPALGSPIKIAGPGEEGAWSEGRAALVSGWGATKDRGRGYADTLQATEITIAPEWFCAPIRLEPTSLCAGSGTGDRDICDGDSGGPLVVRIAGGTPRLVGDTSFGRADHCGTYTASGFGRLAADPIRATLQQAAQVLTGDAIVGSGGTAPATMTAGQARDNAFIYAGEDCARWRPCRTYWAKSCRPAGAGYKCGIQETGKKRRGRIFCRRKVLIKATSGGISRRGIGKWRCRSI